MGDTSRNGERNATRWGRSPAHAEEHAAAGRLQAQYPHMVIWFGEASGHFYAVDTSGLHERPTLDSLALLVWQRTNRPRPRGAVVSTR